MKRGIFKKRPKKRKYEAQKHVLTEQKCYIGIITHPKMPKKCENVKPIFRQQSRKLSQGSRCTGEGKSEDSFLWGMWLAYIRICQLLVSWTLMLLYIIETSLRHGRFAPTRATGTNNLEIKLIHLNFLKTQFCINL